MSFQEPDLSRFERAQTYKPARKYLAERARFEGQSVSKMSYTGERPDGPHIVAARNRPSLPPLSEEERARVCSPVPSPPCTPGAMQPWTPSAIVCPPQRQFEICRPQQGSAGYQGIPNVKDFYSK